MADTNEYNLQISYNIAISEITQGNLGWCYNFTETTAYATHTYAYHSQNLKTLTKHRNNLIKKFEIQREKLDKSSFWKGKAVKHSIFNKIREVWESPLLSTKIVLR